MSNQRFVTGDKLCPEDQRLALRVFVHRFTGDQCPIWAGKLRPDGSAYPVQFASDQDWLRHTEFAVREDGSLDTHAEYCISFPTWPEGKPTVVQIKQIPTPDDFRRFWKEHRKTFWELASHDINPSWCHEAGDSFDYADAFGRIWGMFNQIAAALARRKG